MGYRDPSDDEKTFAQDGLNGKKIAIFWDGDDVYYTGSIVSYDTENNLFKVKYENDDSSTLYDENLSTSKWMIWDESCEDSPEYLSHLVCKTFLNLYNIIKL